MNVLNHKVCTSNDALLNFVWEVSSQERPRVSY